MSLDLVKRRLTRWLSEPEAELFMQDILKPLYQVRVQLLSCFLPRFFFLPPSSPSPSSMSSCFPGSNVESELQLLESKKVAVSLREAAGGKGLSRHEKKKQVHELRMRKQEADAKVLGKKE